MYSALFALGYYGLFRIGELCMTDTDNHTIKAHDIHIGTNKDKILVVLHSSKMHGRESRLQKVKIMSNRTVMSNKYHRYFCPFTLVQRYRTIRGVEYDSVNEPLFIFSDGSPLKATAVRTVLKILLSALGLDASLYGVHSLRIGRASDLVKYGYSLNFVKMAERWRSSAVYRYLRT